MYYTMIKNDFIKSKLITLTTTLFVAAAALLVSLAALLTVNLSGAIATMMSQAKTPHFLQMHSGAISTAELERFAAENEAVETLQVSEFLNVDSGSIWLGETSLSGNSQDNGFSIQNSQFDFLLDLDGNIIDPKDGELYVPICYMRDGSASIGERARIGEEEFIISGFLRDSQMNSLLSSSKRFLVSKNDYNRLKNLGNVEYLIEFRLNDLSQLGAFEASYSTALLPANGPTITWPLFKMLNAISDGIMIGVILIVSILVVIIALLCIRFTLLAKIEEDYREIAVMKAIGMRVSDIRQIYLVKYAVIGFSGCAMGYALSFLFRGILMENIRITIGESHNAPAAGALGLFFVLLLQIFILLFVNSILRRFRRISAAEAFRLNTGTEKRSGKAGLSLSGSRWINTNIFLGISDVLKRRGIYATMLIVLVFAAFIIIVPQNLYSTLSAESFVTHMGIGNCDLRMDIQQTDRIPEKAARIKYALQNDSRITKSAVLTTKRFQTNTAEGIPTGINVELGDHHIFPVSYSDGTAPVKADEIALSALNAKELGKKTGDTLLITSSEGAKNLTVCGIYSDITNGGKTAKAAFNNSLADIMWSIIYVSADELSDIQNIASEYAERFEYAKVTDTKAYISQTYGQTLNSVRTASIASLVTALIIILLVTMLFMKMLIAGDQYSIAVMKACGFTNSDIKLQYISRAVFILILGAILGTLLANTAGESLTGAVLSTFGASSFSFTINPLSAYFICPFMMVCTVLISTILSTEKAGQIKISQIIKE